jgi:hypothetical protein
MRADPPRRLAAVRRLAALAAAGLVLTACTAGSEAAESPARAQLDDLVAQVSESWDTDWDNAVVPLDELILGIGATEPRDVIPPIDEPVYETSEAAARWLDDREPGALVLIDDLARFYPLSILTRHEIVNDTLAGIPVAVTYCPLCNTALTFDRRVEGRVLRFGVSGLLRHSDLVMWDDATTSLWQQITGEGLVGEYAGVRLERLGTAIVSFGDFRAEYPDGLSLSRDTGFEWDYGTNPYRGYSSRFAPLIPTSTERDSRFPPMERVVGVSLGGIERAYPFSMLAERGAINDTVGGIPVAVLWGSPDTADALDATVIADSRAIGTAIALDPVVDGRALTFAAAGDAFTDAETGSTWTILGRAVEGPLAGTRLATVPHRNEFWFAWAAFFPDGEVFDGCRVSPATCGRACGCRWRPRSPRPPPGRGRSPSSTRRRPDTAPRLQRPPAGRSGPAG